MRILLDDNVPVPLRSWLIGHQVETAYERGWAELSNGVLLQMAEEAGFEVMITADQGIRYQQNLSGRRLALVVIDTNDWTRIRKWNPESWMRFRESCRDRWSTSGFHLINFPNQRVSSRSERCVRRAEWTGFKQLARECLLLAFRL